MSKEQLTDIENIINTQKADTPTKVQTDLTVMADGVKDPSAPKDAPTDPTEFYTRQRTSVEYPFIYIKDIKEERDLVFIKNLLDKSIKENKGVKTRVWVGYSSKNEALDFGTAPINPKVLNELEMKLIDVVYMVDKGKEEPISVENFMTEEDYHDFIVPNIKEVSYEDTVNPYFDVDKLSTEEKNGIFLYNHESLLKDIGSKTIKTEQDTFEENFKKIIQSQDSPYTQLPVTPNTSLPSVPPAPTPATPVPQAPPAPIASVPQAPPAPSASTTFIENQDLPESPELSTDLISQLDMLLAEQKENKNTEKPKEQPEENFSHILFDTGGGS